MNLLFMFVLLLVFASFGLIVLRGAPYVPSHKRQIVRAFSELYKLDKTDCLVDLGSGDGVVLRIAREFGADAIGYELNPFLLLLSRYKSRKDKKTKIFFKDYQLLNKLPEKVSVIYAFTSSINIKAIEKKLYQWSRYKSLYFISYGFKLNSLVPMRQVGPMYLYKISNKS